MVGISWRTDSQAATNKFRNIDIVELVAPLVDTGSFLVSLQYGDVSEDLERVKAALGVDIITLDSLDTSNDIEGLAYLISLCRHVVTIDNATVHLAGSLEVPTHLLVPLFSDWRWGLRGSQHSYWYDSVRLHWQCEANNWSDTIMRLTKDLMED
jgi:ADP-heptose:LPS heptosyltransferase